METHEPKKSAVDEAKEVLAQIEKAKAELKAENDRRESLQSEAMLSGQASAGQAPPKQETPKEYKDKVMRGEL